MKKLKIHILMHVPFEKPGCILEWTQHHSCEVTYTKLYEDTTFPEIQSIDWLIVMGGPMGVYDEAQYKWLQSEKEFIHSAIQNRKAVLGICLGSQLIAEVLGAKVYPNVRKEIGWFDLHIDTEASNNAILKGFEPRFNVFHWHGDTFDLPLGSKRLLYSNITPNQAFVYKEKVIGLQFHLEATEDTLREMVAHGAEELTPSDTVWSGTDILSETTHIITNNKKMFQILDYLNSF